MTQLESYSESSEKTKKGLPVNGFVPGPWNWLLLLVSQWYLSLYNLAAKFMYVP